MYPHHEINRVIERAKQQRAEYIGSIARSHPFSLALVAALSLVLLQFSAFPGAQEGEQAELTPRAAQLG